MRRFFRTRRQLVTTSALGVVVVAAAVAMAGVAAGAGSGGDADTRTPAALTGVAVPAEYLPVVQSAGTSCPMLSPARLAGQLMANSSFDAEHTTSAGGVGLAGMTDTTWDKWKPEPLSRRGDATANIIALAHDMCDLSGQLRVAKVEGDPWRNSLAAYQVGVDAVKQASGIPAAANGYVSTVVAYATWYSAHDSLDATVPASAVPLAQGNPAGTPTATPVPAASASAGAGHRPTTPSTPTTKATPSPTAPTVTLARLCNSGPGAPICIRLVNQLSTRCLGVDAGAVATLGCPGDASTVWYWMQFGDGLVHIVNNQTGECLDSNNSSVYLWRCQNADPQEGWTTVPGTTEIQHKASGRCLDGPGNAYVYDCHGVDDGYEQWQQIQI